MRHHMSKRVVLAGLCLLVGGPMLFAETAPLGVMLAGVAWALIALPRLGRRRQPVT